MENFEKTPFNFLSKGKILKNQKSLKINNVNLNRKKKPLHQLW